MISPTEEAYALAAIVQLHLVNEGAVFDDVADALALCAGRLAALLPRHSRDAFLRQLDRKARTESVLSALTLPPNPITTPSDAAPAKLIPFPFVRPGEGRPPC